MRVTNKIMVNNFLANLMRNESKIQKRSNELSTGKRINAPSDDPVGTARSMVLNTNITEITQYTTNSKNASNWLNASDQALMGVDQALQRIYELTVQGASDTSTPSAREALAMEVEKTISAIMELANTNVDNRYIFGGQEVLNKPYTLRASVSGDAIDIKTNPITIDLNNNMFKVKLNDGSTKTIVLTPRTYDGTPGKTLNDLSTDLQKQLKNAGFDLPVYIKVTPDKKLQLYAGVRPADDKTNTLVLKEGPAIKTVGTVVKTGIPSGPDTIDLDANANGAAGYYDGWQIMITGGKGAGQVRTINNPGGYAVLPIKRATVSSPWDMAPDATSTYAMIPPLDGKVTGAVAVPPYTIGLDPGASTVADFYDGMDITIMSGPGAGQTRTLNYNAGTYEVTNAWTTLPTLASTYSITPHLSGTVGAGTTAASTTLQLDANASSVDDFYNGASITVTDSNGVQLTRKIMDYDAATSQVTVDTPWNTDISANATFKILDTSLSRLGFVNQASTKELVSNQLTEPIQVTGKYPLVGTAQVPAGPPPGVTDLYLAADSENSNDYYKNWTVTIINGKGIGQTTTIGSYTAATQKAAVNPPWAVIPDDTSVYALRPPTIGASGVNTTSINGTTPVAGTATSITLEPTSSETDNYYNGWFVNTVAGSGVITGYDGKTKTATVSVGDFAIPPLATDAYTLTPPPGGLAQGGAATSITLDPGAPGANDYYKGWKVRITDGLGAGQIADITGYDGLTKIATADWVVPPNVAPDATSVYTLIPPVGPDQIRLSLQSSAIKDYYTGMPVTITGGTGAGQTRNITAYDPVSGVATLDEDWGTLPDQTSSYSIDANYYVNTNSKFKITIDGQMTQEISLDGGTYNLKELAKRMEAQINVRGGEYANIKVNVTNDNKLRIGYRDPDPDDNDAPMDITLESGSKADILLKLGFASGVESEALEPNYEGDQGISEYEVSVGVRVPVNNIGDRIFDPVFEHLKKITVDLRAGNTSALSRDIKLVQDDIDRTVVNLGEIGAKVNRLEKGVDRLNVLSDNITGLIGHIQDTDFAKTIMELQLQQTTYQAALQAGAKILPPTLLDYLR